MKTFFDILEANWTDTSSSSAANPNPAPVADAPAPAPSTADEAAAVASEPGASGVSGGGAESGPANPEPSEVVEVEGETIMDSPNTEDYLLTLDTQPEQDLFSVGLDKSSEKSPGVPEHVHDPMPPPPVPEKKRVAMMLEDTLNPFSPGLSREETERRVRARIAALQYFGQIVF